MDDKSSGIQKWLSMIAAYDNEFKRWEARTTKIVKRYRDDNRTQSGNETARFNILWSNVQTLMPAVYARMPKAVAARRFGDNDPVGRVASQLLERALDFEIEHYPDFRSTMKYAVEDRFLGGRGVGWVRYEPHVISQDIPEDGLQITEDTDESDSEYGAENPASETPQAGEVAEEIEYECAPTDYVHWKDFGHSPARTWEEVTAVWRWVYMTKEALIERFGEKAARNIPLDSGPEPLANYEKHAKNYNRAKICELWDRDSGKVYWFGKDSQDIIDERDDPLQLEGFYTCAMPLYATTTSDSLVPIPDYVLYQDQANELDILSDRIDGLVKSLRVRGVYDASQPALQRLLTEGDNNSLIPVDKWNAFSEKGGLKGSIDLLPLDTLANALMQCYQARQDIKSQIYEITGISDIIRGASNASETATAQNIKGRYAGLRLGAMQDDVALFASQLIRLKAQVICSKFQPQTIYAYAGGGQMTPEDQQMIPEAMQLLQNDPLRSFRVEVDADSLIVMDETQNKRDRAEFIAAFGSMVRDAIPMVQAQPKLLPMIIQVMKFGVGAFPQAEPIEGALDAALDGIKKDQEMAAQQPPQPPPPDPEMIKAQAKQASDQAYAQQEMQVLQMKSQVDAALAQGKAAADMQVEQFRASATLELEQMRQQHDEMLKAQDHAAQAEIAKMQAEMDSMTKIRIAEINAASKMQQTTIEVI
jgi:hypothetical protein